MEAVVDVSQRWRLHLITGGQEGVLVRSLHICKTLKESVAGDKKTLLSPFCTFMKLTVARDAVRMTKSATAWRMEAC